MAEYTSYLHLSQYSGPNSDSYAFFRSGQKIDYILRKNAPLRNESIVLKTDFDVEQVRNLKNDKTNSGLYKLNSLGKVEQISIKKAKQEFAQLDTQFVWDGEITISNDSSNEFKFGDFSDFKELTEKFIPSFLKKEQLDMNDVNYYYAVHKNTKNLHVHFLFFENKKSFLDEKGELHFKKKGKISLKNMQAFSKTTSDFIEDKQKYREDFNFRQNIFTEKLSVRAIIKNEYQFSLNQKIQKTIDYANENNLKQFKKLPIPHQENVWNYFLSEVNQMSDSKKNDVLNYIDLINAKKNEPKNKNQKEFLDKQYDEFKTEYGNFVLKELLKSPNIQIDSAQEDSLKLNEKYLFALKNTNIQTNFNNFRRNKTYKNLKTRLSREDWNQKQLALKRYKDMIYKKSSYKF